MKSSIRLTQLNDQDDVDDENLNITGYNEHFSITSWIKHIRKEKLPPNNFKTILEA